MVLSLFLLADLAVALAGADLSVAGLSFLFPLSALATVAALPPCLTALLSADCGLLDWVALSVFTPLPSAVLPLVFSLATALAGWSFSTTFTGVLSFSVVSEAAVWEASGALSVSTSRGWPGLPRDFIEMPWAS